MGLGPPPPGRKLHPGCRVAASFLSYFCCCFSPRVECAECWGPQTRGHLPLSHPSCPPAARSLDLGPSWGDGPIHDRPCELRHVHSPRCTRGRQGQRAVVSESTGVAAEVDTAQWPQCAQAGKCLPAGLLPPAPGNARTLSWERGGPGHLHQWQCPPSSPLASEETGTRRSSVLLLG